MVSVCVCCLHEGVCMFVCVRCRNAHVCVSSLHLRVGVGAGGEQVSDDRQPTCFGKYVYTYVCMPLQPLVVYIHIWRHPRPPRGGGPSGGRTHICMPLVVHIRI